LVEKKRGGEKNKRPNEREKAKEGIPSPKNLVMTKTVNEGRRSLSPLFKPNT